MRINTNGPWESILPMFFKKYSLQRWRSLSQEINMISGRFCNQMPTCGYWFIEKNCNKRLLSNICVCFILYWNENTWNKSYTPPRFLPYCHTGTHIYECLETWKSCSNFQHLILIVLHDLSVWGLLGQQLSSSALQNGLHCAEAWTDPWCEVEVLPLHRRVTENRKRDSTVNHQNN